MKSQPPFSAPGLAGAANVLDDARQPCPTLSPRTSPSARRPFIAGAARHSMGGQSLARDGTVVTMDQRWLEADTARKTPICSAAIAGASPGSQRPRSRGQCRAGGARLRCRGGCRGLRQGSRTRPRGASTVDPRGGALPERDVLVVSDRPRGTAPGGASRVRSWYPG